MCPAFETRGMKTLIRPLFSVVLTFMWVKTDEKQVIEQMKEDV